MKILNDNLLYKYKKLYEEATKDITNIIKYLKNTNEYNSEKKINTDGICKRCCCLFKIESYNYSKNNNIYLCYDCIDDLTKKVNNLSYFVQL